MYSYIYFIDVIICFLPYPAVGGLYHDFRIALFIFRPNQTGLGFLYYNLHIVLPKGNHRRITGNKLSSNRITPAKPKASKIYPHNTKSVPSQIYN